MGEYKNRLYTTDRKDSGREEETGKDGRNVWSQNGFHCVHDGGLRMRIIFFMDWGK